MFEIAEADEVVTSLAQGSSMTVYCDQQLLRQNVLGRVGVAAAMRPHCCKGGYSGFWTAPPTPW